VIFDTSAISKEQKKYLPLLRELLVESPILDTDAEPNKLIPFEEVVANLERTWLSYGCSMGIDGGGRFKCGSFSHTFVFNNQVCLMMIRCELCIVSEHNKVGSLQLILDGAF